MPPRHPNARALLVQARKENNVELLKSAIEVTRVRPDRGWTYEEFIPSALSSCIRDNRTDLARYLFENESGPIKDDDTSLKALPVDSDNSIEMLKLLVTHGWDVNQKTHREWRLIDVAFHDDEKVRFLLDHNATVDHGATEIYFPEIQSRQPPGLLEKCAAYASFETFQSMRERGAKLGRRTLHRTAACAASMGADPKVDYSDESKRGQESQDERKKRKRRWTRVAILWILVDEIHLDVNSLDTDEKGHVYWDHYHGTPLCYVARNPDGLAVAKWLLDKGADPRLKNTRDMDAVQVAREKGHENMAKLFEEWIEEKEAAGTSWMR